MAKRSLKEMTQGMTFSEKAEYLWEYYWWILLVAAFAVVVGSMVITGIVNTSKEILYSGAAVNVQISEEGTHYLTEGLEEQFGGEKDQKAELFVTSFQDLETTSDAVVNSAAAMQVVLMITAGDYDYVIMDEVALDFYKNHPVFTALDETLPEEIFNACRDRVFYHETQEQGKFPLAIDITDSAFAQGYMTQDTKVYIAFPGNTGRTESNDDFLTYLMDCE
ncbi:MAG: hypothetical protein IJO45_01990 [Oscillospiraceae bacterium]|nr:hypothetical protein [Oscillospiraceae bacterium]